MKEMEPVERITRDEYLEQLRRAQINQVDPQVIDRIEGARQAVFDAEMDGLRVSFYKSGDKLLTEFVAKEPLGFKTR